MKSKDIRHRVWDFLYYGYLPRLPSDWRDQQWATVPVLPDTASMSDAEISTRSAEAFEHSVARQAGRVNVVLLSGGNDSRAILGALLRHYTTREIVAVTYGTPGTYDFDIPHQLARIAGVEHVAIDLTNHTFALQELKAVATELRDSPSWIFGPLMNRLVTANFGTSVTYWSGYLGGPVTGSHAPAGRPARTWAEARERHAHRGPFGGSLEHYPLGYSPLAALPTETPHLISPLTKDELVDLAVRQYPWLYSEHVVTGHKYELPFLSHEYLALMFNAGGERRVGQGLYLSTLETRYPLLFSAPHKDHLGLPPRAGRLRRQVARLGVHARRTGLQAFPRSPRFVRPSTNHIDWNQALRYREDLGTLADDLLGSLGCRALLENLDPTALLARHRTRQVDAGLALTQLMSLELYLQMEADFSDAN